MARMVMGARRAPSPPQELKGGAQSALNFYLLKKNILI